jgi:hypothetical protein
MAVSRSADIEFHCRRAAKEQAAADSAACSAARDAHRELAREHELAAYRAAREASSFQLFDDAAFIRFATRVSSTTHPLPSMEAAAQTGFKRPPHEGIGTLLR